MMAKSYKNRVTQIIAIFVLIMGLTGVGYLSDPIDRSRRELGFDIEINQAAPPWITLPTTVLGSFRGVMLDVLWYRATSLQDEGKYFEANQLAHWITTLQPRFPQVWSYQAWNMAYNISVATYTPQERWSWVNKGITLLRDKGIVYNPKAIRLYRELSWIYFHKFGKFMDDMHWYYRQQLAMEWHELLGAPLPGATTQQALEWFRTIAQAPDSLEELLAQEPSVESLLTELRLLDYAFGVALLRQIGRVKLFDPKQAMRPDAFQRRSVSEEILFDQQLGEILANTQFSESVDPFVAWLRKKVLRTDYHMDPTFMFELMQQYGPLDWRHPMSHSCYWSEMGVKMATMIADQGGVKTRAVEIELLNTNRQTIHVMQELTRFGRIVLDPMTGRFDLMPDARFIPAYSLAVEQARSRVDSGVFGGIDRKVFDRGHENFLLEVMYVSYLYGDLGEAQAYYQRARELYGRKDHNRSSGRYQKPLAQLVVQELRENLGMMSNTWQLIRAMLERAFDRGLAYNEMTAFDRFVQLARLAHERYQIDQSDHSTGMRGRMKLVPFDQVLIESYLSYMQSAKNSLFKRSRVWANTPVRLQRRVSDRLLPVLHTLAKHSGFEPFKMFPDPLDGSGLPNPEHKKETVVKQQAPIQIERQ